LDGLLWFEAKEVKTWRSGPIAAEAVLIDQAGEGDRRCRSTGSPAGPVSTVQGLPLEGQTPNRVPRNASLQA